MRRGRGAGWRGIQAKREREGKREGVNTDSSTTIPVKERCILPQLFHVMEIAGEIFPTSTAIYTISAIMHPQGPCLGTLISPPVTPRQSHNMAVTCYLAGTRLRGSSLLPVYPISLCLPQGREYEEGCECGRGCWVPWRGFTPQPARRQLHFGVPT